MKTTATKEELYAALDHVNAKYAGNICFKTLDDINAKRRTFTLTVNSSKEPGARYNPVNGRRFAAACWHVHGDFFDYLWSVRPDCLILAGTLRMNSAADNWQDSNVGSYAYPVMFSESCHCNE